MYTNYILHNSIIYNFLNAECTTTYNKYIANKCTSKTVEMGAILNQIRVNVISLVELQHKVSLIS